MAVSKAIDDPGITIRRLRPVHSSKLHRVYEVILADGTTLELVMPPPSLLRLLRSERQIIHSEAVVVQWLRTVLSKELPARSGGPIPDQVKEQSPPEPTARGRTRPDVTGSPRLPSPRLRSNARSELLRQVPEPLVRSVTPSTPSLGGQYSIYRRREGSCVAELPTALTKAFRADIDSQLGQLTRQFAEIESPTGRFGHAVSIITGTNADAPMDGRSKSPPPATHGLAEASLAWSATFNLMFEAVLRDAEDMAVMLAYPMIRKHLVRLSYVLDDVAVPSLVFVDGTEDTNVLVAIEPSLGKHGDTVRGQASDRDRGSGSDEGSRERRQKEDDRSTPKSGRPSTNDKAYQRSAPSAQEVGNGRKIRVVGLRDWSNGIFGDPLLATAFSDKPSKELLDGFYETTTDRASPPPARAEQSDSTKPRLLLYQAYHATVAIVTEFYRPHTDSTIRELAARRKLTEALTKLEEVEDDPKQNRHRRPSGAVSPAKRLKPDDREKPSSSMRQDKTT